MASREVTITRISPFSAFRTGLALSLAGLAAWVVCVIALYYGLAGFGVWDKMNSVIGGAGGEGIITFGTILSVASLVGAVSAIIVTVVCPLLAIVYNGLADIFGGITVKVKDNDY